MRMQSNFGRQLLTVFVAASLLACANATAKQPEAPAEQAQAGEESGQTTENAKAPEYWIGIGVAELSDVLRAQLKLEGGVVVDQVFDDSPAAAAGVQQHDILLQFAGQDLKDARRLVAVVEENKDAEAELVLLRGGERITVKATPRKRPERALTPQEGSQSLILNWAQNLAQAEPGKEIVIWQVAPGRALPGGVVARSTLKPLPPNTSVTIKKDAEGRAQVDIERGGKTWNVTSETVDELPEDLREPIRQLFDNQTAVSSLLLSRAQLLQPYVRAIPPQAAPGDISATLETLIKKIDALAEEVEELKKNR